MHDHLIRKYFLLGLFIVAAIFSLLVFRPFIMILILGLALSTVLSPIYNWFNKHLKSHWVSALITVVIFVFILFIPLFGVGVIVFKQAQSISAWISQSGGLGAMADSLNYSISHLFPGGFVNINTGLANITERITNGIGSAFTATISTVFSLLLVILSMFYFLKDGTTLRKTLVRLSPLSDESDNKIIDKLRTAVAGIVRGYLLIGAIQGLLLGIGLWIFGVPNAALWGVVAGIASFVPMIGTAFVAVPAVIFLIISGHVPNAIGLGIWATALVGTIDNLLSPFLIGRKIEVHPIVVLFAVLGGISLFGPIGILIGPLIISFMYALVSVYKTETV